MVKLVLRKKVETDKKPLKLVKRIIKNEHLVFDKDVLKTFKEVNEKLNEPIHICGLVDKLEKDLSNQACGLEEKTVSPSKRELLNGDKVLKPKVNYAKSNVVSPNRKVRYMIQYWNEQSSKYGKIPIKLNEIHGGNQTKVFQKTVHACNNFLKGSLLTTKNSCFPDNIVQSGELAKERTYEDFVIFVDRFMKVLHDNNYYPVNKMFVRTHSTLLFFLVGCDDGFNKFESILFRNCFYEPKIIVKLKNEKFHKCVELAWLKWQPDYILKGKDYVNFDNFLTWFIAFCKNRMGFDNDIKIKQTVSGVFMKSVTDLWTKTKPNTAYLPSDRCQEEFIKYLRKLGM